MTPRPQRAPSLVAALLVGMSMLPAADARAQTYPTRPVRFIVGFPPGGPNDILARLVGQWLSDRLDQPFVVENRPGASGNIATEAAVRAPPHRHTPPPVGPAHAISRSPHHHLSFHL